MELDTAVFDVLLDSVENAKTIEEISFDSSEYTSVLMLPLCCGINDDNVKYYALGDDHYEYHSNNNWRLPQILLENNVFTGILNDDNEFDITLDNINVWDSVEKINELVGMHVKPIHGTSSGVITSCYFVDDNPKDSHARWSVTYYDGHEIEDDIAEKKIYNAAEIGDITLI